MRLRLLVPSMIVVGSLAGFLACGGKKPPPKEPEHTETVADAGDDGAADAAPPAPKSLYDRLGGKEAIAKVVDTLVKNVLADNKINARFKKVKKPDELKAKIVDFIAVSTGCTDCKYDGKNMKDAHKGMKIKAEEWDAFMTDFKNALDENKVGADEQNDLAAALLNMRGDVVEVEAKAKPGGKK